MSIVAYATISADAGNRPCARIRVWSQRRDKFHAVEQVGCGGRTPRKRHARNLNERTRREHCSPARIRGAGGIIASTEGLGIESADEARGVDFDVRKIDVARVLKDGMIQRQHLKIAVIHSRK